MKNILIVSVMVIIANVSHGQVGGGSAGYSQQSAKAKAEQIERAKRILTKEELPPTANSSFVDASVLINVKADEYVAVFGISHEGVTLDECNAKMNATVKAFIADLKPLGIVGNQLFVDFVTQSKIYVYETQGDILQEKLVGFALNKNISIHYKSSALLEKITLAAAKSQLFDLVKVDYIVRDIESVQNRLMQEAARIIKIKLMRYEKMLGIKLGGPTQVYAERAATHFPTQMYDSYTAQESEQVISYPDRQRYTVKSARKGKTFFFNALDADGFDVVINPVIVEPVVQFTLYLKVAVQSSPAKGR